MTTKVLELLINLAVKGQQDAAALSKAVQELKTSFSQLKGMQQLDQILNGKKAAEEVDVLDKRIIKLKERIAAGFAIKADIDLTKLEDSTNKARDKARALKEEIAKLGPQFDIVTQRGRQMVDLITQAGRTKIDFDLGKIETEAVRAANALKRLADNKAREEMRALREQARQTDAQLRQLGGNTAGVTNNLLALGREAILVRRILFSLGFSFVAQEALNTVIALDKVNAALETTFGKSDAPRQLEFIRVQAERLGLGVADLADQWAKYSLATKNSNLTDKEKEATFLAVAEAGAKLSLSQDNINGALTALQQIASKGRLSLEELRQQLGDRLPGAIQVAAKALKLTEAQLFSLIEAGQITADEFLRSFGPALRQTFGTDTTTRIETTGAAIARFKQALQDLTNEALRAGALDAFINILKSLTELFKDPATIANLKALSKGFADLITFIKDNQESVKALIIAYAGFKGLSFVRNILVQIASGLAAVTAATSGATAANITKTAAALTTVGTVAPAVASTATAVSGLAAALLRAVAAASVPITIVVVGATAVRLASIAIADALSEARQKALDLNQALQESAAADAAARRLQVLIDSLAQYRNFTALALESVNKLTDESLIAYNKQAEGAKKLADAVAGQTNLQIASVRAQIAALEQLDKRTDSQIKALVDYREKLADLLAQQAKNSARQQELAATLKAVEDAARKAGVALDPYVKSLQDLAKTLPGVKQGLQEIEKIDYSRLDPQIQRLIDAFKKAREEGKATGEAIDKAFSTDFGDNSVEAITKTITALTYLQQQGLITGKVLEEEIAKRLQKMSAEDLQKFQINAKAAFDAGKIGAEAFSNALKGALAAGLAKLGLDAETAGKKISKEFKDIVATFTAIATNAKATTDQIAAAFNKAIDTAKTREELELLKKTLQQLRDSGVKSSKELEDAQQRLADKIRELTGVLTGALGDSFKRLGIESAARLDALAQQAQIDFNRIRDSGQASALELEKAFRAAADKIIAANNGIPPISLTIQAVDFNAFDIIVKAAQDASARVREAIKNAIPLVETARQAEALGRAITEAFNKGKISADEYRQLITQITFLTRELAAKTTGEVAAAAELLGVKSKAQLEAVAANARDAFKILLDSGQFTYQELASAAQKYLEAATAANDGVVTSFDSVAQAAQEIIDKVKQGTSAIQQQTAAAQQLANTKLSDPVSTGNLKDLSIDALQQLLRDTAQSYRNIGVTNVEQLQIIKEIQNELTNRGKQSQAEFERQKAQSNQPTGGAAQPTATDRSITININGSNLTPADVRDKIVPILRDFDRRTR